MRNLLVGLVAGAVLGALVGLLGGLLAVTTIFHHQPAGPAQVSGSRGELLGRGSFQHVEPTDPLHYGVGGVQVYTDRVQLDDAFEVGPGPKYRVYLAPDAEITTDTRVEETMFVDLGPLAAFSGSQAYPVPRGVDPRLYGSVVIWSEHFNRLISPAPIELLVPAP